MTAGVNKASYGAFICALFMRKLNNRSAYTFILGLLIYKRLAGPIKLQYKTCCLLFGWSYLRLESQVTNVGASL
jgi:hypothetical protein